jgi:hypothetical protein
LERRRLMISSEFGGAIAPTGSCLREETRSLDAVGGCLVPLYSSTEAETPPDFIWN